MSNPLQKLALGAITPLTPVKVSAREHTSHSLESSPKANFSVYLEDSGETTILENLAVELPRLEHLDRISTPFRSNQPKINLPGVSDDFIEFRHSEERLFSPSEGKNSADSDAVSVFSTTVTKATSTEILPISDLAFPNETKLTYENIPLNGITKIQGGENQVPPVYGADSREDQNLSKLDRLSVFELTQDKNGFIDSLLNRNFDSASYFADAWNSNSFGAIERISKPLENILRPLNTSEFDLKPIQNESEAQMIMSDGKTLSSDQDQVAMDPLRRSMANLSNFEVNGPVGRTKDEGQRDLSERDQVRNGIASPSENKVNSFASPMSNEMVLKSPSSIVREDTLSGYALNADSDELEKLMPILTRHDALPAPNSSSNLALSASTSHNNLAQNVVRQIATALEAGQGKDIEVRLDPEELGKVRMLLTIRDGMVSVQVLADRPETLELLRRNSDELAANMSSAGFGEANLRFGEGSPEREPADQEENDPSMDMQEADISPTSSPASLNSKESLDLRL